MSHREGFVTNRGVSVCPVAESPPRTHLCEKHVSFQCWNRGISGFRPHSGSSPPPPLGQAPWPQRLQKTRVSERQACSHEPSEVTIAYAVSFLSHLDCRTTAPPRLYSGFPNSSCSPLKHGLLFGEVKRELGPSPDTTHKTQAEMCPRHLHVKAVPADFPRRNTRQDLQPRSS